MHRYTIGQIAHQIEDQSAFWGGETHNIIGTQKKWDWSDYTVPLFEATSSNGKLNILDMPTFPPSLGKLCTKCKKNYFLAGKK